MSQKLQRVKSGDMYEYYVESMAIRRLAEPPNWPHEDKLPMP